jgi:hypothetical protein
MAQIVLFVPDHVHNTVSKICSAHAVTKPSAYVALLEALTQRPDVCQAIIMQHGKKALSPGRKPEVVQVKLRHSRHMAPETAKGRALAFLDSLPDSDLPLAFSIPRKWPEDTQPRTPLKLSPRQASRLAAAALRAEVEPHQLLTFMTRDDDTALAALDKARAHP